MNKRKVLRIIVSAIYFLFISSFCLILSGVIEFFPICDYYKNPRIIQLQFFVPLVVYPIIGWLIAKFLNIEKSNRFFYYLVIPIICTISIFSFRYSNKKKIANLNVCIVSIAKIKDTYAGNQTNYVDVSFRKNGHRYKRTGVRFLGKGVASTLHIGDSLLVLSVMDCDAIMYVYKPHPTLEEFKKCEDYGYYANGILYSKDEFEEKLKLK